MSALVDNKGRVKKGNCSIKITEKIFYIDTNLKVSEKKWKKW